MTFSFVIFVDAKNIEDATLVGCISLPCEMATFGFQVFDWATSFLQSRSFGCPRIALRSLLSLHHAKRLFRLIRRLFDIIDGRTTCHHNFKPRIQTSLLLQSQPK